MKGDPSKVERTSGDLGFSGRGYDDHAVQTEVPDIFDPKGSVRVRGDSNGARAVLSTSPLFRTVRDLGRRAGTSLFALVLYGVWSLLFPPDTAAEKKTIFGWVEKVQISPDKIILKAKLDTGAKTSSLHAIDLTSFRKNGQEWVRFKVMDPESGKKVAFERHVVRKVRIKEHNGPSQVRPVVLMEICLGGFLQQTEMSLVDRTSFIYEILLGRRMLSEHAVVDPSLTFTSSPTCEWTTNP